MVDKAKRLEEVIETMFSTVLHMEIWRNPAAMVASQGHPHISASVQVTGSWIGVISLTIPVSLAETLAAGRQVAATRRHDVEGKGRHEVDEERR